MQRYSLLFGIIGILAGIVLLIFINIVPRPVVTPLAPVPVGDLIYNVGKAHELPGTSSMLYENSALGIRFGYPKSYGTVVVEKFAGEVDFSFSPSNATNDPSRAKFMVARFAEPTETETNWGDLSWDVQPDPRWVQRADVCALVKESATTMPSRSKQIVNSAVCVNLPFQTGGIAKLIGDIYPIYLIPAFQTTIDRVSLDMFVAAEDRLTPMKGYENPTLNIEKLVNSIDFIEPTK